jgi:branched-chain amino acid aminotransferase
MTSASDHDYKSGCAWDGGRFAAAERAKISLMDVGFCRSDVTYDVVSVWDGSFFRLDEHVERFQRSCRRKGFQSGPSISEIRSILFGCVQRSALKDAYVEMIMTRGLVPATTRDPRRFENNFYAYAIPYVSLFPDDKLNAGVDLIISKTARRIPATSVDPTVKNFHWADLTSGLIEAYENGADTAVLLDEAGSLTEGPGFNVFGVKGRTIVTPRAGVLLGITRRTILELAGELGLGCAEEEIPASAVREFDEMFLTSTAGGVIPVGRIDDHPLLSAAEGSVTRRLRALYWNAHERASWRVEVDYGSG